MTNPKFSFEPLSQNLVFLLFPPGIPRTYFARQVHQRTHLARVASTILLRSIPLIVRRIPVSFEQPHIQSPIQSPIHPPIQPNFQIPQVQLVLNPPQDLHHLSKAWDFQR